MLAVEVLGWDGDRRWQRGHIWRVSAGVRRVAGVEQKTPGAPAAVIGLL